MKNENKQDRIDAYLLDNLSPEERQTFAGEVAQDQDLAASLADTELAMSAIELHEDQALKARLQNLEKKLAGAPAAPGQGHTGPFVRSITDRQAKTNARVVDIKQRRKGTLKLLGYAAALLLVLAVGWWSMNLGGFDSRQLAMDTFKPYDNITTGTVRGDNDATLEAAAYADYDAGNYAAAQDKLADLAATDVNKFYLGQSLLAQEKFAEAHDALVSLVGKPDFALAEEAAYYYGLAQLGMGDLENAKETLSEISTAPGHPYQKEAKTLLAKL